MLYLTVYMYVCVHCVQSSMCMIFHSAKGNDDMALNEILLFFHVFKPLLIVQCKTPVL